MCPDVTESTPTNNWWQNEEPGKTGHTSIYGFIFDIFPNGWSQFTTYYYLFKETMKLQITNDPQRRQQTEKMQQ